MLPNCRNPGRLGPLPSPPLNLLTPPHHPGHPRAGLSRSRYGQREPRPKGQPQRSCPQQRPGRPDHPGDTPPRGHAVPTAERTSAWPSELARLAQTPPRTGQSSVPLPATTPRPAPEGHPHQSVQPVPRRPQPPGPLHQRPTVFRSNGTINPPICPSTCPRGSDLTKRDANRPTAPPAPRPTPEPDPPRAQSSTSSTTHDCDCASGPNQPISKQSYKSPAPSSHRDSTPADFQMNGLSRGGRSRLPGLNAMAPN